MRDAGGSVKISSHEGLSFSRFFTQENFHPYDQVKWEKRMARITGDKGEVIFEQEVEFPDFWSETAVQIVASKYFRGQLGTPEREYSLKQLIERVVNTITLWGIEGKYFSDTQSAEIFNHELTYLILYQVMIFNSPVEFNIGVPNVSQQSSACFLLDVEDTMDSILNWYKEEGKIFVGGSGSGVNLSKIRSSKEYLSGGGTASGPLSFAKAADASSGVIKCLTGDTWTWTKFGRQKLINAEGEIATGRGSGFISAFFENGIQPIHAIKLSYTGLQLRGTGNHPVLTMTLDGLKWKNIEDLEIGDPIAVARNYWLPLENARINYQMQRKKHQREYNIPSEVSPDLGCLLGMLVADGCIEEDRVRWLKGDIDTVNEFKRIWLNLFDIEASFSWNDKKHAYEFSSYALDIAHFLKYLGLEGLARTKVVPWVVFQSSRSVAEAFLRGYFDGDGHNGRAIFAVSASRNLRDDLQYLLLSLGYIGTRYTSRINGNEYYGIRLSTAASELYATSIGFISKRKETNFDHSSRKQNSPNIDLMPCLTEGIQKHNDGTRNWYAKNRVQFVHSWQSAHEVSIKWLREHPEEIEAIAYLSKDLYFAIRETLKYNFFWDKVGQKWEEDPAPTYDLTVEENHSFVANGIICHNSGGRTRRSAKLICLDISHPDIEDFIWCKVKEEKKAKILIGAGYDNAIDGEAYGTVTFQNANNSIQIPDEFMQAVEKDEDWNLRYVTTGEIYKTVKAKDLFYQIAQAAWEVGDPACQYSTTINKWHTLSGINRILTSNPCGEYLSEPNSACNLACLNLLKFLGDDNIFNIQAFRKAVDLTITAQEILVSGSDFPTEKIAKNARAHRQLGLGYSNLGALLMSLGLAYDSYAGRELAASITVLMTGEAYLQSSYIAKIKGPFDDFEVNRQAVTQVMNLHNEAASKLPENTISDAAKSTWSKVLLMGAHYGYRNSQTVVLAPNGTTGLALDCDTTGVEPSLALVAYKKLVGGGMLKLVNKSVERGLKSLGYFDPKIRQAIIDHISNGGELNECPYFNIKHASVFDTAFGDSAIAPMGHVRMIAAVQPFISGGISKTCNIPNHATVEDIEQIYMDAWKMGIKSISVYRDGCKASQPLNVKKDTSESTKEIISSNTQVVTLQRRRLPDNRPATCHKFDIAGNEGYIHVGFYEDGTPGEVFIRMAKEGSTISGLMDTVATLTSMALQYGVPLETLVNKFRHVRFEPSGFTKNKDVPYAKSLTDYLFGYLQHLPNKTLQYTEEKPGLLRVEVSKNSDIYSDGSLCPTCGDVLVRAGSCFLCKTCGTTSGCS